MPGYGETAEFIAKVGFPIFFAVVVMAFAFAVWRFASPLLRKLVESHIAFVETMNAEQPKLTGVLEQQSETSKRLATAQEQSNEMLGRIADAVLNPQESSRRGRK